MNEAGTVVVKEEKQCLSPLSTFVCSLPARRQAFLSDSL